jgi:hypothetical protein
MTRRIRIISIIGAALVLAPSAFAQQGERFQEAPQSHQALTVRSEGMNQRNGLGQDSPAIKALQLRSEALNRQHGLGGYAQSNVAVLNARERAFATKSQVVSTSPIDARERALSTKVELQLASDFYADGFAQAVKPRDVNVGPVRDDRFRLDPTAGSEPVTATSSARDIEWSQLGIGFGIGLVLALGMYLAARYTRIRPVAH